MSLNAALPPGKTAPLWSDLGRMFGEAIPEFSPNNPLDAISAFEHEFGRVRLVERLSEMLHVRDGRPGEAHRAFCSISFDIVCTTNFDFLLEKQYDALHRYAYPVVGEDQLSVNGPKAGTLLLKLHGDLHHPNRLVVTEDDYDAFLARFPLLATYLSNQLITKTAVLVGYSLDDPDFRQVWNVLAARLGSSRRPAYSIMVGASPSDIARFQRRGVKVINLPGTPKKYGEILAAAFDELCAYQREKVIAVSQVTREAPRTELMLPRDARTRLCFFAVPLELLSWYKENAFPLAEEAGFVPVTAEDVVSPGDNINAKIDALIDRASVMVVDTSSEWTRSELQRAWGRLTSESGLLVHRPRLEIVVVRPQDTARPSDLLLSRTIDRPSELVEETQQFVSALGAQLYQIAETVGLGQRSEPQRLLELGESRAAVIAAMSLLEAWLRRAVGDSNSTSSRVAPMRSLVERAIMEEVLPRDTSPQLESWIRIRNQAVHTNQPISRAEAARVVSGILAMIPPWAAA
ncbi:MAG: SIR2 family protein [Verrucomicrobiaceae bacterium]|nr:MAG: SIR2 family protein [Verrucomicrobiaceae bacterium]